MDEWLAILGILALAAGAVAGLAAALPWLKNRKQGYPLEAEVEAALLPYLFSGICGAYRVSEWAMDRAGRRLRGADKQAIAAAIYRLLPDSIPAPGNRGRFDLTLVKRLVPPERFAQLVEDTFDRFDALFALGQSRYQELFQAWLREYRASATRPKRPSAAPGGGQPSPGGGQPSSGGGHPSPARFPGGSPSGDLRDLRQGGAPTGGSTPPSGTGA